MRLPAAALALLALAGCATVPPPATVAGPDIRREVLLGWSAWEARGRVAARTAEGGGQGNLQWVQRGDSARLRLSGPFGAGAWEIEWDPDSLRVRGRDDEELRLGGADAAERFLDEQLGWSFPVASTRYWIRGLADPEADGAMHYDDAGKPLALDQHGWRVLYQEHVLYGALWLPRRLVMESARGRVRLVIDAWKGPVPP